MANEAISKKAEDLTGQSRFAWNLFVSWSSQLVLIFSGFIMPRLVDEKIGQVALGIWDFGWAFVSYLTLVGLGMGACFNRYIAKHRAAGEITRLNQVANSVVFVQIVISLAVLLFTGIFYLILPSLFGNSLADNTVTTQWVVVFLGASLAIQMLSGSARGLLTGYHRWDIHNALHAGSSVLSLCLMLTLLFTTQLGVVGMAIGYFTATLTFECIRFIFVAKICQEFKFNLRLANWATCKEMLIFGIKSMLSNLPPILLLQTINIMIVAAIGPAALAIFARPMALTRQIKTFMAKFTLMLTPTTGSMQGGGDLSAIRDLFVNTTRLSFAFSLPSLGFLFIFGDLVLAFWMGPDYALWPVVMILALGQLLPMAQDTSIRILMGLNRHGRISIFAFVAVFVLFVILLGIVGLSNWTLTTAAWLLVMPLTLIYGIVIPLYTCTQLQLSWRFYIRNSILKPFLYVMPFYALLAASRYALIIENYPLAIFAFVCAVVITLVIYFIMLVPTPLKSKIQNKFVRIYR
jgi:O-antigen/teichoic acid export membrane protein